MDIYSFQNTIVDAGRTSRIASEAQRLDTAEQGRLKEASRQFEALFVKQMLDSMRGTVEKSGLIDTGFAGEIYEDMLFEQYAAKMSKVGSFGIAEMIYNQFSAYV